MDWSEGAVCQWHTSSTDRAEGENKRRPAQRAGDQAETEENRALRTGIA